MGTRMLSVELDDETLDVLATFGPPADVLKRLAASAAESVGDVAAVGGGKADRSLRRERETADRMVEQGVAALQDSPQGAARIEWLGTSRKWLLFERQTTDKLLLDERARADRLQVDQREANAQMIDTTIRAQELRDDADAALRLAEKNEQDLRTVAEFREMFIAILGHDLRTPLGSISMSADLMLRRGTLDDRQTDLVARIQRSSDRITRMVSQLLDLTQTRLGGGMPVERATVDFRAIGKRVVDEFHASIEFEATGDTVGEWDGDRLEEMLSNLAGNAIEHAFPGTPVTVTARADDADVVIEIRNSGKAIPADVLPFIFEPFRRAHQPAKSAASNLGLGLYIASQIVLAHGGVLTAASDDGVTTFFVRSPFR